MSILVGLPFHPKKTYALPHVLEWVEKQTYKDVEIVMRWHTGQFGGRDAVKQQREFFRLLALNRGHDYFYSMGVDTIPPLDILAKLEAAGKDVVGAVYRQRKDHNPAPIAWRANDPDKSFMIGPGLVRVDGMGMDAVLLSREAYASFSYFDWPTIDDDGPAYSALRANGFEAWLDKDQVCRHYMTAEQYV